MKRIPNSLSCRFNTLEGRQQIIRKYGTCKSMYFGKNEHGESVYLSVAKTGIILKTEQHNGWVRVNYYDEKGFPTGESFDGRWC